MRPIPRASFSTLLSPLLFTLVVALVAEPAAAKKRNPPPPEPDPQKGAIGVSLRCISPTGADRVKAAEVRFVRVDRGGGAYASTELIPSNYTGADGRVYLLDAEPGRYAAVAFRSRGGSLIAIRDKQWAFLEKELIDATTVSVRAGGRAFAGHYVTGCSPWFSGAEERNPSKHGHADEAQVHYVDLMFPKAKGKSSLARIYGKNPLYLASTLEKEKRNRRDAETEREFWSQALKRDFDDRPSWRTALEAAR